MLIIYELSRGMAYRRIDHPDMHWYTITLPLILTVLCSAIFYYIPEHVPLLGKDGVVSQALTVISTLPGFYFAGLAAVATFNGLNMDSVITDPAPSIKVTVGGVERKLKLSRRQFLSYLFSYLVLISLILSVASVAVNAFSPSLITLHEILVKQEFGEEIWLLCRTMCLATYLAAASSLLVTTLHGMFFLTERIHQP